MKYIQLFNSFNSAKGKKMYSPNVTIIKNGGNSKSIINTCETSEVMSIPENSTVTFETLTVNDIKPVYVINYTTEHGTVKPQKTVNANYVLTSTDLEAPAPIEGWEFKGWLINGVDKGSETYYVNANVTLTATWQEVNKNITVYIDNTAREVDPEQTFAQQSITGLYNSNYYAYEDLWGTIYWCPINPVNDKADNALPIAGKYYYTTYRQDCVRWENCLTEDTMITMADGTEKPISEITHDDDILVWDFYNGCAASAKPLLIKVAEASPHYIETTFSDGTILKTVGPDYGYHRIFNADKGVFEYVYTEVKNGTTTYKVDGTFPTVVSQEMKQEMVEHYNVITEDHYNLFANGILTSCRLSNKFAIGKDMKYYGEQLISDEEITNYIAERKENTNKWI